MSCDPPPTPPASSSDLLQLEGETDFIQSLRIAAAARAATGAGSRRRKPATAQGGLTATRAPAIGRIDSSRLLNRAKAFLELVKDEDRRQPPSQASSETSDDIDLEQQDEHKLEVELNLLLVPEAVAGDQEEESLQKLQQLLLVHGSESSSEDDEDCDLDSDGDETDSSSSSSSSDSGSELDQ